MGKILVCFGTRPEWIKVHKLVSQLALSGFDVQTLKINQHETLLSTVTATYTVNVKQPTVQENRLDLILATISNIPEKVFSDVSQIIVQGDTATAFMCAMAGFNRSIPVVHLEAGMRTHDKSNPFPEELYRQLISRVATYHLCATTQNKKNLELENIISNTAFVVGNTVLDNLVDRRSDAENGNEVLVTLHRRENHSLMDQWFLAIRELADKHKDCSFVMPMHPNPNVQKHRNLLGDRVMICDPLEHSQFINRLLKCKMVISDSGGIQEECAFLGKKVIVCRKLTERPESLGMTSWLATTPYELRDKFETIKEYKVDASTVFGDGTAVKQIVELFKSGKIPT
jgi:UDP-N-acetylglucosamine 2-epimerase (non-hydrolysing)